MAQIIFNEETREFSVTDMVVAHDDNKTKRLSVRESNRTARKKIELDAAKEIGLVNAKISQAKAQGKDNRAIAKLNAKNQRQLNKLKFKAGKEVEKTKRLKDYYDAVANRRTGAGREMAKIISNHQLQKRTLKNAEAESRRQHKTNIRLAKINALKELK